MKAERVGLRMFVYSKLLTNILCRFGILAYEDKCPIAKGKIGENLQFCSAMNFTHSCHENRLKALIESWGELFLKTSIEVRKCDAWQINLPKYVLNR